MINDLKGNDTLIALSLILLLFVNAITLYLIHVHRLHMPAIAVVWMLVWLSLAMLFTVLSYQKFVSCYLLGLFCMLISWRIAAIYRIDALTYTFLIVFILYFINFIYCAHRQLKQEGNTFSLAEWHVTFIRIYIGLNFIPHFTEKLFAGPAPHLGDVNAFIGLGVPNPDYVVWLAGCCEFGAAIALGLGLFMRIGALGAVGYLLVAAYLGHHFNLGFIWADPGGGWEFTAMWITLIFSFVVTGAHRFSIDHYLEERFSLPGTIKKLM